MSSDPSKISMRKGKTKEHPRPNNNHHSLLEDHYRVDPKEHIVLPGLPTYDDDFHRDIHDFFNLIVLVPVVMLNILNWNWDILLDFSNKDEHISDAWTGEWFSLFWWVTLSYFIIDMVWVAWIPSCVKSPGTIIKHHIATLLYLMIPFLQPHLRWFMGACMSVEVNTWFLIARRMFNKQGFSPWVIQLPGTVSPVFSIRIKFISIFFYTTWVSIRCILYPFLLWHFGASYVQEFKANNPIWNWFIVVLPIHSMFCMLNIRWTYDLLLSKTRYWKRLNVARRNGKKRVDENGSVDKGL